MMMGILGILAGIVVVVLFHVFLMWRESQGLKDAERYMQNCRLNHQELKPWELRHN